MCFFHYSSFCGPHTSSIVVAVLGSHWSKKSTMANTMLCELFSPPLCTYIYIHKYNHSVVQIEGNKDGISQVVNNSWEIYIYVYTFTLISFFLFSNLFSSGSILLNFFLQTESVAIIICKLVLYISVKHFLIWIYLYICICICVVLSISFPTFFVQAFKIVILLQIQYVITIHLLRWLTNSYDFSFKRTATAAIGIHPTKTWLSQLVNFKNAIWMWGYFRRTICNKIVF